MKKYITCLFLPLLALSNASAYSSSPLVLLPKAASVSLSAQQQLGMAALMGLAACNAKAALMPRLFKPAGAAYEDAAAVFPHAFNSLAQTNLPLLRGSFMEGNGAIPHSQFKAKSVLSTPVLLLPDVHVVALDQYISLDRVSGVSEISWTLDVPASVALEKLGAIYQLKSDDEFFAVGRQLRCRAALPALGV